MKRLTSVGLRRARSRKHRRGLEDLVRAPQFEALLAQISSRSADVRRSGRSPSSASTRRTCRRNVSAGTPRSRATCAIGRPLSITTRAPRSSSSGGYFLGRAIAAERLLSRGQNPRFEVSVKSGPAHMTPARAQRGVSGDAPHLAPAPTAADLSPSILLTQDER